MEKIVVTGATGMIGINFIKYVMDKDVEVLAIVRGNSTKAKLLPKSDKIKIIECDLSELNRLNIEENNCDIFLHLAWEGTSKEMRNDVNCQIKNIQYTIDALNLAKKMGCSTFIGAGSQAEYGRVEGNVSPDTKERPDCAYGIAKLCAGQMSRLLARQIGINHIWTRILSIYGPYDNENTMIMTSIKNMLNDVSPDYTKAEQLWDYLYVEDVARALYLIGKNGKNNSIYCIGSGEKRHLYEYIEEIRNQINPSISLNLGAKQYESNQVMNLCADITNLTNDTGFLPNINFREGIKKTVEWYKNVCYNNK